MKRNENERRSPNKKPERQREEVNRFPAGKSAAATLVGGELNM